MDGVNAFPPEAHPFILATSIMAAFFIAAMIRLWLLRRVEDRLLKNRTALEKQIIDQQREVLAIRSDSQQWRAEMKREFDGFRAMASDQLKVEEKRFDDLLRRSEQRQLELQTALDIARQMCAELPAAKARILQLEQALGLNGGEDPPSGGGGAPRHSGGGGGSGPSSGPALATSEPRREWDIVGNAGLPAVPSVEEERSFASHNAAVLKALAAARQRSRSRTGLRRLKVGK